MINATSLADCHRPWGYNPFKENPNEEITKPNALHPKIGLGPCIDVCGEMVAKYLEKETEANFSALVSCVTVKLECDPDYEKLKQLKPILNHRNKRSDDPAVIALEVVQIFAKISMILATFLG